MPRRFLHTYVFVQIVLNGVSYVEAEGCQFRMVIHILICLKSHYPTKFCSQDSAMLTSLSFVVLQSTFRFDAKCDGDSESESLQTSCPVHFLMKFFNMYLVYEVVRSYIRSHGVINRKFARHK